MSSENLQPMIERYKKQLLEFSKKSPQINFDEVSKSFEDTDVVSVGAIQKDTDVPLDSTYIYTNTQENENAKIHNQTQTYNAAMLSNASKNEFWGESSVPVAKTVVQAVEPIIGVVKKNKINYDEPADIDNSPESSERPYSKFESDYASYDDFIAKNSAKGSLKVQVFAADRAFPLSNARIVVTKKIAEKEYAFYDELTDSQGTVTGLLLPTKAKGLSQLPSEIVPFSTYSVSVEHPNFINTRYKNVLIFDGVESLLPANMVPLTAGANEPAPISYDSAAYTN